MGKKKIIYIMQRDNWQKDNDLNNILIKHLKRTSHKIIWEDPAGNFLYRIRQLENRVKHIPESIRKTDLRAAQFLYGLFHWNYFSYLSGRTDMSADTRTNRLKKDISKLMKNDEIVILSRSSGARFASLASDDLNIKHIICLGYPFKHPNHNVEPERYLHLANLKTPMLIVQGNKDEYGGIEVKDKYSFSPSIELEFVDANHNFNLCKQDWNKVLAKIDKIINAE